MGRKKNWCQLLSRAFFLLFSATSFLRTAFNDEPLHSLLAALQSEKKGQRRFSLFLPILTMTINEFMETSIAAATRAWFMI